MEEKKSMVGQSRAALEMARHELTTLHGLIAADGMAPTETWTIDTNKAVAAIDAVFAEISGVSGTHALAQAKAERNYDLSTLIDDKPIFKISNVETGHRWEIYADGRITGFEGQLLVVNLIPIRMIQLLLKLTSDKSELMSGSEHSTAE